MSDRHKDRDGRRYGIAALLIAVGVIMLGDRLGWTFGWGLEWDKLWPVVLIIWGVGCMAGARRLNGGLWAALAGVLLLLHNLRILTMHYSWPIFVIAGGVMILFGGRRRREPPAEGQ